MEEVDTELVVEELGHHLDKQAFLVAFKLQEVVSTLLDRYQNLVPQMGNSIATVGATKPVEPHRFPSTLEVKRLVAKEDPVGRLRVSVAICL